MSPKRLCEYQGQVWAPVFALVFLLTNFALAQGDAELAARRDALQKTRGLNERQVLAAALAVAGLNSEAGAACLAEEFDRAPGTRSDRTPGTRSDRTPGTRSDRTPPKSSERNARRLLILRVLATQLQFEPAETILREAASGIHGLHAQLFAIPKVEGCRFDWRTLMVENVAADLADSAKHASIKALGAPGDHLGITFLIRCFRTTLDRELQAFVIRVAAQNYPAALVDPNFVRPHILERSNPALRVAALGVIGRRNPEEFLKRAQQLKPFCISDYERAGWIYLWAQYGGERAWKEILALMQPGGKLAQEAFVEVARVLDDQQASDWFRTTGIADPNPRIKRAVLAHLSSHPKKGDFLFFKQLSEGGPLATRFAAITCLGQDSSKAARKQLRDICDDETPIIAALALRVLFQAAPAIAPMRGFVLEVADKSPRWQLRIAAMEILRGDRPEIAAAIFRKNCDHKNPFVRSAAYKAMTYLRRPSVVDFMIDRLGREKGRPLEDLATSLSDLTSFHWGTSSNRWKKWWTPIRDEFPLPPKKQGNSAATTSGGRYGQFYGINIDSARVAFVIDVSRSMKEIAPRSTSSRLRQAKIELKKVLDSLSSHNEFAIIAFSKDTIAYDAKLRPAKDRWLGRAKRWVDGLQADGGTNFFAGIKQALAIPNVDTIFVLSDGAPSVGDVTSKASILEFVQSYNRFRHIRIHTIGIGLAASEREFLSKLAGENRGRVVVEE
ncbi:MAG: VWA domain-containing protein [Planctomycetota bacterium]